MRTKKKGITQEEKIMATIRKAGRNMEKEVERARVEYERTRKTLLILKALFSTFSIIMLMLSIYLVSQGKIDLGTFVLLVVIAINFIF